MQSPLILTRSSAGKLLSKRNAIRIRLESQRSRTFSVPSTTKVRQRASWSHQTRSRSVSLSFAIQAVALVLNLDRARCLQGVAQGCAMDR